jgi:hypothetical protein
MKKAFPVTVIVVFLLCIGLMQVANAKSPASTYSMKIGSEKSAGATGRNVTLDFAPTEGSATGTIATHLVVYGYIIITDAEAAFIASHFDLVILGFELPSNIQKIRAANPTIKLIGYKSFTTASAEESDWSMVNQHEDWFLHSTVTGERVRDPSVSQSRYRMDFSNAGWQNHIATWCANQLAKYPMVDGIFADNVEEAIRLLWSNAWSVPVAELPTDYVTNFNAHMVQMLQTVKNTIGSKLLVVNTPDVNALMIQYCDGQMIEHFLHRSQRTLTDYTQTNPTAEISLLEKLSATGKIVLASSGATIPQNPTATDIELVHKCVVYCLSGFLLGYSGKASFGFESLKYDYTGHNCYWDEMDAPIGTPVGAKYNVQGDLWARDFTAGRVFLNIGNLNTYTVNVAGTDYEVKPRSGLIAPATGGKVNTQITFTLSPNPASPGVTATLSGTLKDTANNPVYPTQVKVEYSTNGGATWNSAWTMNTNSAGGFSNTFTVPGVGTYLLRVSYAGSVAFNPSTNTQTLTVQTGKLNTQITFTLSPNPASPGVTATLSGTLKDANLNPIYPGQVKVIYSTNGGTTWSSALTLNTNSAGAFSKTFSAPAAGTYLIRASYAGSTNYNETSRTETLKVQ